MKLKLPFRTFVIAGIRKKYEVSENIVMIKMTKGETIILKNGFE